VSYDTSEELGLPALPASPMPPVLEYGLSLISPGDLNNDWINAVKRSTTVSPKLSGLPSDYCTLMTTFYQT